MNATITLTPGEVPYQDQGCSYFDRILTQALMVCGQFFGNVDIDSPRNQTNTLSDSILNWLTSGREKTLTFRESAKKEFGIKGLAYLSFYDVENFSRKIRQKLYLPTPQPEPISGFTRVEKLGTLGVLTLAGLWVTLAGNSSVSAEKPVMSGVVITPTNTISPILPRLTTRPEVGVYADPHYRYPHLRIVTGPSNPITVRFESLAGASANSGWYARYIGIPMGKIPTQAEVNPLAQHARMFAVKFNPKASWEVQPVARSMDKQYAEMYNTQRTHMTLPQFVEGVRIVINETKEDINWEALCADRRIGLNQKGCDLLRQVTDRITSEMLIAYGMTELFPREQSNTQDFNRRVLENGLVNYGREFWDLTPAQSDGLASAGLWQLTSKAVGAYIDEEDVPRIGGVTIVGRYVTNRPPESFLDFKRTDHEQAAYLFAVHNIALLIKEAAKNPGALATMQRVWVAGDRQLELLQYIATAHHAPYGVYKSALRWLKAGAVKPYQYHLRGRFVEYAKRTRLNWPSMAPRLATTKGDVS